MANLDRGTYLQPEEYAYPAGGQTRRGRAVFPDGEVRRVWAGIPDTYFSIPAHGWADGKYVRGSLTIASAPDDDVSSREARWYAFTIYAARCPSRYDGAVTLLGRKVRCELRTGHDGQHGHSFAARYWS